MRDAKIHSGRWGRMLVLGAAGASAGAAGAGPGSCCRGGRSYIADEKRAVRGRLSCCPDLTSAEN